MDLPRHRAVRIARSLATLPAVEGVCLFGSVARGQVNEWSDIDILVVGSDAGLVPSALLNKLPADLKEDRVTLLYYLRCELRDLFAARWSFSEHLRREGEVLYDRTGFLTSLLRRERNTPAATKEELNARLDQLNAYNDLRVFKGNFLFVLGHLYTVGKAVTMLALAAEDAPEFNREAAFLKLAERHPELASDVNTVAQLRPFYRLVTRRGAEPLPFAYRGADREVTKAIAAVRRLARAVG